MKKESDCLTPEAVEKLGTGVRIKPVRCGKKRCHKCPHFIYVYKRIYKGGKTKEIYIGKLKGYRRTLTPEAVEKLGTA